MNFKQKLGYMCIGCLFTIAGYMLASLGGGATHAQKDEQVIDEQVILDAAKQVIKERATHAQKNDKDVIDEIVCRQIKVVNRFGKTMIVIKGSDHSGGRMTLHNGHGEVITLIRPGRYNVYARPGVPVDYFDKILRDKDQGEEEIHIGLGQISIGSRQGNNLPAVRLGRHIMSGTGYINVYNGKGKNLISIGATEGRPNDGLINIYNHKGEWRSISKD